MAKDDRQRKAAHSLTSIKLRRVLGQKRLLLAQEPLNKRKTHKRQAHEQKEEHHRAILERAAEDGLDSPQQPIGDEIQCDGNNEKIDGFHGGGLLPM